MGASLTTKSASSATNVNPAPLTQIPTKKQAPVWQQLSSLTFNVFRARNSHGSCVFKNKMWITGGRSEFYLQFDLHSNNKQADVWWSSDGSTWYQEVQLKGDFWAQNDDAVQPGPVAPWYARFGHSLTSLPPMAYKTPELMVLMGGYSPDPSNDIWVTEDGNNWIYCEHAAWSPRGWHGATLFKGMLWVTGGSPLNNEVWYLKSINQVPRRQPLTRSMYNNYTYVFDWAKASDGGYSPRAGIGFVSHWFFNQTNGETFLNSTEHLVVIGGFGGWLEGDQDPSHAYDGAYSRNDVWYSLDGMNWTLAIANAPFTGRAWFGCTTSRLGNPVLDVSESGRLQGGKLFVMGGGYVGSVAGTNQQVLSIDGAVDTWWTRDLVSWNKVNYDQGGNAVQGGAKPWQVQANYASKVIPLFSTELWAKTTVSSQTRWLGVWGMSVLSFNATSGDEFPGDLFFIGGGYAAPGSLSASTYQSQRGLHCDIGGITCNGHGKCMPDRQGCHCHIVRHKVETRDKFKGLNLWKKSLHFHTYTWTGEYCQNHLIHNGAGGSRAAAFHALTLMVSLCIFMLVFNRS